jgi:uncharacterized membrane protein YoaK (UPF0700 family)
VRRADPAVVREELAAVRVSILALGRVFIANMTGNVVFIGFALAGAPGFSLIASLLALVGFLVGAAVCAPVIAAGGRPGVDCSPW